MVRRIADRQHGVITRAQLLELGLNGRAVEHRIRTGRLHPLSRGVYALGRPRVSIEGRWLAAVLSCGPTAVLSHASAASLWGMRPSTGALVHVSVPERVARRRPGIRVHRRAALGVEDRTVRTQIPVTNPTQTLIDIAVQLPPRELEATINEADKLDLVNPEQLAAGLRSIAPRPGIASLRRVVERETFRLTASELERMMLRIIEPLGIGAPQTGARVNGFEVDFFWPSLGLVIETDGLRYHRTPAQQARDRIRDQAHTAAGLTSLRFTHAQVRYQPAQVTARSSPSSTG